MRQAVTYLRGRIADLEQQAIDAETVLQDGDYKIADDPAECRAVARALREFCTVLELMTARVDGDG